MLYVKKFTLNSNGEVCLNGEVVQSIPPVDRCYILLIDKLHIRERESGYEALEQLYDCSLTTVDDIILSQTIVKYDFSETGVWSWVDAKAYILQQLHIEERSE
jgi:hypothetical protein